MAECWKERCSVLEALLRRSRDGSADQGSNLAGPPVCKLQVRIGLGILTLLNCIFLTGSPSRLRTPYLGKRVWYVVHYFLLRFH